MLLNYREYGAGHLKTVFFLHGLLGNADNWGSTCRELSEQGFRCIAVDQRNHGASPHSSEMNYPAMAEDLIRLADFLGIDSFSITGHSMGGKTAMETALSYPYRTESVIVADIAPIRYKPAYTEYINSLKLINLEGVKNRSDVGRQLEQYIPDRDLRLFFLTNLRRNEEGQYSWRINIEGITGNYGNIWTELDDDRRFEGPALFIRGGNSDFIQDSCLDKIKALFPSFELETIEGASHWVHSEKPAEFRKAVGSFLKR